MQLRITLALLAIASTAAAAPNTEYSWNCKFKQTSVCEPTGCRQSKSPVWIYLTPSQQSYYRCEGTGFDNCDRYQARVGASGNYRIFELPGRAGFAKVDAKLGVTEVMTLMDVVLINRGQCTSGPPPLVRIIR